MVYFGRLVFVFAYFNIITHLLYYPGYAPYAFKHEYIKSLIGNEQNLKKSLITSERYRY